jgi:hypothetical protein
MDILRFLVAIIVVFGLLGALYFLSNRGRKFAGLPGFFKLFLRPAGSARAGQPSGVNGDSLRVIKRLNLSATHQVHLLQIEEENVLLCTHPQGCTVLRSSEDRPGAVRLAEVQRRAS